MSKAEEFIKKHSHVIETPTSVWISSYNARKAVEIAREEVIEKTAEWITKHAKKYYFNKERYLGTDELVEDYKLIMSIKDE